MTIEELSKSYKDFRDECGLKDPVALNEIEVAYEEGAYKVLKEIETRIEMGKHASMQTDKTILESVEMAINELKGKE